MLNTVGTNDLLGSTPPCASCTGAGCCWASGLACGSWLLWASSVGTFAGALLHPTATASTATAAASRDIFNIIIPLASLPHGMSHSIFQCFRPENQLLSWSSPGKPCIFFGPDQNSCHHLTLAPHYFSVVLVTSNRKNHRQVTNKPSGIMRCASPFLPRLSPPSSHLCSLRQRFPAAHTRTPCRSR